MRSPYAHARILAIDTSRAMAHPDVIAVLTARELEGRVRPIPLIRRPPGQEVQPPPVPPLASSRVPRNIAFQAHVGSGDVEGLFRQAAVVVRQR